MAGTTNVQDENTWAWACPYCGVSNDLDAAACVGCGAQLRDPDEDDLFTTAATENAQIIEPDATVYNETPWTTDSAWTTESATDDDDVLDAEAEGPGPEPTEPAPPTGGPFSATERPVEAAPDKTDSNVFGAQPNTDSAAEVDAMPGRNPFGSPDEDIAFAAPPPQQAPPVAPVAPQQVPGYAPMDAAPDPFAGQPGVPTERSLRPTPDENGLASAVDLLDVVDRERCSVPIAVCGALLGDHESVLNCVSGQMLGHAAIIVLTSHRAIVANSRRWKPLVDIFDSVEDLTLHLRHDSEVASLTFIQGDRLTSVDNITNVAGAMSLEERVRSASEES